MSVNLWIDCDPGHDDAFALLLASHSDDANLIGVSAVHGNASLTHTLENCSSILDALDRIDVPLFKGLATPLTKSSVVAANIHGKSGIDGSTHLPPPWRSMSLESVGNLDQMVTLMDQFSDIHLCATGPLTNIAYLTLNYPDYLRRSVKKLVIMGGAMGLGNVTSQAEFNTWCDPEALKTILHSDVWKGKLVLMPLELTHQAILSPRIMTAIKSRCKSSNFASMWIELGTFFGDRYRDVFGFQTGGPIHDPTTVAYCLSPEIMRGRDMYVDVDVSDTYFRGRLICDVWNQTGKDANVYVCTDLDTDQFWEMVLSAMEKGNLTSPVNA